MVIELKRPCKPGDGFETPSNRWVNQSSTRRSPKPKAMDAARVKRLRRVQVKYDSTRIPEVNTVANRKVVTPPRTGLGTMAAS